MYWFKNAMIYRLTKDLDWSEDQLQQNLAQCEYHPCGQSDMSKFGWTNPLRGSELLHFSVNKQILCYYPGHSAKINKPRFGSILKPT